MSMFFIIFIIISSRSVSAKFCDGHPCPVEPKPNYNLINAQLTPASYDSIKTMISYPYDSKASFFETTITFEFNKLIGASSLYKQVNVTANLCLGDVTQSNNCFLIGNKEIDFMTGERDVSNNVVNVSFATNYADVLSVFPQKSAFWSFYDGTQTIKIDLNPSNITSEANQNDNEVIFTYPVQCTKDYQCDNYNYDTDSTNDGDYACVAGACVPGNPAPIARDDEFVVNKGKTSTINPLKNDFDIKGETINIASVSTPQNGKVMMSAVGDNLEYTPNPSFEGIDSFDYVVEDVGGKTASANVNVYVTDSGMKKNSKSKSFLFVNNQLIADTSKDSENNSLSYYQLDFNNNVRSRFDENGVPIDFNDYLPFGMSVGGLPVDLGFKGLLFDQNSELYTNYDPGLRRFISFQGAVFNLWDSQTLNSYSFMRNNPYRKVTYEDITPDLSIPKGQDGVEGKSVTGSTGLPAAIQTRSLPPQPKLSSSLAGPIAQLINLLLPSPKPDKKKSTETKPPPASDPEITLDDEDYPLDDVIIPEDKDKVVHLKEVTMVSGVAVQVEHTGNIYSSHLVDDIGKLAEQTGAGYFDKNGVWGWNLKPGDTWVFDYGGKTYSVPIGTWTPGAKI